MEHTIPILLNYVFPAMQHVLFALQAFLILAQPAADFTISSSSQPLVTLLVLTFTSITRKTLHVRHAPFLVRFALIKHTAVSVKVGLSCTIDHVFLRVLLVPMQSLQRAYAMIVQRVVNLVTEPNFVRVA